MGDGSKEAHEVGRDELNLCEFPITLIADRAPKGLKTLVFDGNHGRLTITGSDDLGLPTALDADVIVGLIQLTKQANGFTDPKVNFTRYELLKLMGWPDQGRQYQRLDESLRRWVGVTLRWDKSWWDNEIKCRVDANFHILDNVVIIDREVKQTLRVRGQRTLPFSMFKWNEAIFRSFQADNVKRLNLETYFSLRSAISKQLYRFLDKRFYLRDDWSFDLRRLACGHVGLSPNYAIGNIKQKLRPAVEELEAVGFLKAIPYGERFNKAGRGEWRIHLAHKRTSTPVDAKPEPTPAGLEAELVHRGVTRNVAAELVMNYPADRIKAQVAHLDGRRRKVKDAGAWLASAIRGDFAPPKAIDPPTKAEPQTVPAEAPDEQARQARAQARAERLTMRTFWEGLSPAEREAFDAEALAHADTELRAEYDRQDDPRLRRLQMLPIRDAHLRARLAAG
jgi:hypothetical protein